MHTTNSPDAFSFGARLTPGDALRFAKGQSVACNGAELQIQLAGLVIKIGTYFVGILAAFWMFERLL